MKMLFDKISAACSKTITKAYSTSFSLGIKLLGREVQQPIYAIYGFVRLADEIVDSFQGYQQATLLEELRMQTSLALEMRISLNPVLNSFQEVVHRYHIDQELIDTFLDSMEMDLQDIRYSRSLYEQYILGSAEVVGLMCLKVFTHHNPALYEQLKTPAMKLGAAFQKVNFLRDVQADTQELGRHYFPQVTDLRHFSASDKALIETEIDNDFHEAITGIRALPASSRKGVQLAYAYYRVLFNKIKALPPQRIMTERIRVPNGHKLGIMLQTLLGLAAY